MSGLNINECEFKILTKMLSDEHKMLQMEIAKRLSKQRGADYRNIGDEATDRGEESFVDLYTDLVIMGIDSTLKRLNELDQADSRIRSNYYGLCVDCDRPLGNQRLNADPAAARCISCQTKAEDMQSSKDVTPSL